jgi:hypothetical protein
MKVQGNKKGKKERKVREMRERGKRKKKSVCACERRNEIYMQNEKKVYERKN